MIKLHNFNEAFQHFQQHQITFRLLQDQAALLIGLFQNSYLSISNPTEITQADIDWLLQQVDAIQSYDALLGGYVYICETESDLLEIHGCNFEWAERHGGHWPNVTDIPMSWDACNYLEEISGNPEWSIFLLCWNNAGGSVYYVPKHLWLKARVAEHIAASECEWNL